ncbi:distal tail protein Dit [Bacillus wiedmannii]|uniref:distal tail protein Dit n=1 Tax=Bacillus wiedmannii TaxID=1890302 RepID=UPI000BF23EEC|nr:distal tail protein Dit [Bacillus wiedmannii]PEL63290.1 phage tail protein [Bacillus wiedmannii]PEU21502.1 phage tail protein [Bacillus wiedmannii]PFZ67708.1 phage tail protein [Bacillus wiedmannii]PHC21665.1 phage tail protein [Bacillus wiedmannii]
MSLTIDGKSLNQLGLALLPGFQHPAAPPVRDYTVSIPGRPGAYYFGSDIDPLEFNLPLIIKPQENRFELAAAIRKMVAVFVDHYGKPKEVKLIYDYEPDKYYLARYSGSIPIERYLRMGKFELPMVAYNPYAYSIIDAKDNVLWGDDIPFMSDIPFLLEDSKTLVTTPTSIEITNPGSLVVRPKIVIFGNAENFALTINGERYFVGNFTQSTVTIDAEYYTAVRVRGSTQSNLLFNLQGDLEKLRFFPGINTLQVAGDNMNVTVDLQFRAKYI